jgi:hypothetical protein
MSRSFRHCYRGPTGWERAAITLNLNRRPKRDISQERGTGTRSERPSNIDFAPDVDPRGKLSLTGELTWAWEHRRYVRRPNAPNHLSGIGQSR